MVWLGVAWLTMLPRSPRRFAPGGDPEGSITTCCRITPSVAGALPLPERRARRAWRSPGESWKPGISPAWGPVLAAPMPPWCRARQQPRVNAVAALGFTTATGQRCSAPTGTGNSGDPRPSPRRQPRVNAVVRLREVTTATGQRCSALPGTRDSADPGPSPWQQPRVNAVVGCGESQRPRANAVVRLRGGGGAASARAGTQRS